MTHEGTGAARPLLRFVLPSAALGLVGLLAALHVASLTDQPFRLDIFFYLFRRDELAGSVLWLVLLLAGVALASRVPPVRIEELLRGLGARPGAVALLTVLVLGLATQVVYRDFPLSMDEYAATFQAQIFAAGRLAGRYPPDLVEVLIPSWFVGYFFTVGPEGQVISSYWPGHALLLAPFNWLHVPWLLNPVLAGAALLLLARMARTLFPGTLAPGWVMLLTLASPDFTANAISYYSMTAHFVCNLVYATLLLVPTRARLVVAGLVGSWALVLHNPVPHAVFALPWIAMLALGSGGVRRIAWLLIGYLPVVLIVGVGWFALRTSISEEGQRSASRRAGRPGLEAPAAGAVVETGERASEVGRILEIFRWPTRNMLWGRALGWLELCMWAAPGLLVLAVLGLFAVLGDGSDDWESRDGAPVRRVLLTMAGSAALTLGFYLFVPFSQGHGWGFRYFHQAWWTLPLLAAAVLVRRRTEDGPSESPGMPLWIRSAALCAALALVAATGLRFSQVRSFIDQQRSQIPPLASQPLEAGGRITFVHPRVGYYRGDLIRNDPFLRDPNLLLVSRGKEADLALIERRFPGARLVVDYGQETIWEVPGDWAQPKPRERP